MLSFLRLVCSLAGYSLISGKDTKLNAYFYKDMGKWLVIVDYRL